VTAVIALAAFALCWLALALAVTGLHRPIRRWLHRLHADPRAALLLALAVLPLGVAALVAVLGFAPLVGGWVVDEHCHPTTGCATHVPAVHADALFAASLLLGTAIAAGALLWSIAKRLRKSLLVVRSLRFLAERRDRQPYELIESRERFAYCVGLLRPRVVLSQGLISSLSPRQLDVVLRHELAHAARRDNLRLWIAGLALLPCPRWLKQPLLSDLALAGEQACDGAAATVGGHTLVVETLNALGRTPAPLRVYSRVAFEGSMIASRVGALRAENLVSPPAYAVGVLVTAVYAASAIAATDFVHHATELLVGALTL
jgi:beta-lactamase regulating signal transducer with metallopeptidase domain